MPEGDSASFLFDKPFNYNYAEGKITVIMHETGNLAKVVHFSSQSHYRKHTL